MPTKVSGHTPLFGRRKTNGKKFNYEPEKTLSSISGMNLYTCEC